jgi:hypothetical protein
MDNSRRKPGRPKTSSRTAPLVLDVVRNLTTIELALPAATAKTLAEYAAWVRQCADLTVEEATTTTVDFALREVFRRDRLWRDERRIPDQKPVAAPSTVTPSPTALSGPTAVPPRRAAE